MALYASTLVTSTARATISAKNPGSTASSILRPSSVILRYPCSTVVSLLPSETVSTRRASQNPPQATTQPPKYVYPHPIPEFAVAETKKFREEILRKLSKDEEAFGDDLKRIVNVCAEIFSEFLHTEYGGPGTLLVEPFTEMFVALNEKKLPRPSVAARACLLWAQNYVDEDWEVWNAKLHD